MKSVDKYASMISLLSGLLIIICAICGFFQLLYAGLTGHICDTTINLVIIEPEVSSIIGFDRVCKPKLPTDMVLVPAGPFTMGSNPDVHEITLAAFYIDTYEVINAQFAAFLNVEGNQKRIRLSRLRH